MRSGARGIGWGFRQAKAISWGWPDAGTGVKLVKSHSSGGDKPTDVGGSLVATEALHASWPPGKEGHGRAFSGIGFSSWATACQTQRRLAYLESAALVLWFVPGPIPEDEGCAPEKGSDRSTLRGQSPTRTAFSFCAKANCQAIGRTVRSGTTRPQCHQLHCQGRGGLG